MGFLKAMKGAKNAWGQVVCEYGAGTFGPENFVNNTNHRIMLTIFTKTITVGVEDIASIEILSCTSEIVKYLLVLKNGEKFVLFLPLVEVAKQGKKINGKKINGKLLNFEWWLFACLYNNVELKTEPIKLEKSLTTSTIVPASDSLKTSQSKINPTGKNDAKAKGQTSPTTKRTIPQNVYWVCRHCGTKNADGKLFCAKCFKMK